MAYDSITTRKLPQWVVTILLLLAAFSRAAVAEEELFLGVERGRIEQVIELGYGLDPSVEAEIQALADAHPESPVSGMLESGYLYWMQNYREWDETWMARFEERAEAALEKAKAYLKTHKEDPDAHFAVAMIELAQVLYYVDHHRWWAAFWKTGGSLKTMRRLVEKYPEYNDAKMPLGMANCYLSKTPAYLKPLAFLMRFRGDWDLGIEYLEAARDKGLFLKVDAGYHLAGIRIELEKDRRLARDELAKLAHRFPSNLNFRALLAELERGLGNQEVARDLSLEILETPSLKDFPPIEGRTLITLLWSSLGSGSFELTLEVAEKTKAFVDTHPLWEENGTWPDYVRAEALLGLGRRNEALSLWRTLSVNASPAVASASGKRLEELEKSEI